MRVSRRTCPSCGYTSDYANPALADAHHRRHSCAKHRRGLEQLARRAERLQARVTRECTHPQACHQHGTRAAYVRDRCRCTDCTAANTAASRTATRERIYGRQPYVDAGPVREHALHAGYPASQAAVHLADRPGGRQPRDRLGAHPARGRAVLRHPGCRRRPADRGRHGSAGPHPYARRRVPRGRTPAGRPPGARHRRRGGRHGGQRRLFHGAQGPLPAGPRGVPRRTARGAAERGRTGLGRFAGFDRRDQRRRQPGPGRPGAGPARR